MPRRIGYARVSTDEQIIETQIHLLKEAGCDLVFDDTGESGAKASRPKLDLALAELQPGDTLVVWRLDRLGRSLKHLVELNDELAERGVAFESLMEKLDTSTAMGRFVFHILAAVAELERQIIRERTIAGMRNAARHGRFPGRPSRRRKVFKEVTAQDGYLERYTRRALMAAQELERSFPGKFEVGTR